MRREQSAVPEVSLSAQEHFLAQTRLYQLLAVQVRHYTNGESGSVLHTAAASGRWCGAERPRCGLSNSRH